MVQERYTAYSSRAPGFVSGYFMWSVLLMFSVFWFCDFCLCSVSCVECYLCLWIVHSYLTLRFSLTFICNYGVSWSWSYGSWIDNYLCNKCISHWSYEFESHSWQGVVNTTLCDQVCQWLPADRWFLQWLRFPLQ